MTDMALQDELLPNALSAQDLGTLGAQMSAAGLSPSETRAVISMVEQAAKQVALSMAPVFLNLVQRTHRAACWEIERRLRNRYPMGFIGSRDQAINVVRDVARDRPQHY